MRTCRRLGFNSSVPARLASGRSRVDAGADARFSRQRANEVGCRGLRLLRASILRTVGFSWARRHLSTCARRAGERPGVAEQPDRISVRRRSGVRAMAARVRRSRHRRSARRCRRGGLPLAPRRSVKLSSRARRSTVLGRRFMYGEYRTVPSGWLPRPAADDVTPVRRDVESSSMPPHRSGDGGHHAHRRAPRHSCTRRPRRISV